MEIKKQVYSHIENLIEEADINTMIKIKYWQHFEDNLPQTLLRAHNKLVQACRWQQTEIELLKEQVKELQRGK